MRYHFTWLSLFILLRTQAAQATWWPWSSSGWGSHSHTNAVISWPFGNEVVSVASENVVEICTPQTNTLHLSQLKVKLASTKWYDYPSLLFKPSNVVKLGDCLRIHFRVPRYLNWMGKGAMFSIRYRRWLLTWTLARARVSVIREPFPNVQASEQIVQEAEQPQPAETYSPSQQEVMRWIKDQRRPGQLRRALSKGTLKEPVLREMIHEVILTQDFETMEYVFKELNSDSFFPDPIPKPWLLQMLNWMAQQDKNLPTLCRLIGSSRWKSVLASLVNEQQFRHVDTLLSRRLIRLQDLQAVSRDHVRQMNMHIVDQLLQRGVVLDAANFQSEEFVRMWVIQACKHHGRTRQSDQTFQVRFAEHGNPGPLITSIPVQMAASALTHAAKDLDFDAVEELLQCHVVPESILLEKDSHVQGETLSSSVVTKGYLETLVREDYLAGLLLRYYGLKTVQSDDQLMSVLDSNYSGDKPARSSDKRLGDAVPSKWLFARFQELSPSPLVAFPFLDVVHQLRRRLSMDRVSDDALQRQELGDLDGLSVDQLNDRLFQATVDNDVVRMREVIQKGADPYFNGNICLWNALRRQKELALSLLLLNFDYHPVVYTKLVLQTTLSRSDGIHLSWLTVEMLSSARPAFSNKDRFTRNAKTLVSRVNQGHLTSELIEEGSDTDNALVAAVKKERYDDVRLLLSYGADPAAHGCKSFNVHWNWNDNRLNIVELLLDYYPRVTEECHSDWMNMFVIEVFSHKRYGIIRRLVKDAGYHLDRKFMSSAITIPVQLITYPGMPTEAFQVMLSLDENIAHHLGGRLLIYAAALNRRDIFDLLCERGANVPRDLRSRFILGYDKANRWLRECRN